MSFNPQEYITKIKGKDYLEVKWRLVWFRDDNPVSDFDNSLRLKTKIVEDTGDQGVVVAELYSPLGELLATAHKREHKKEFHDYLEKAETGAIGRVLAIAGYGTQFAEELELPEGKLVDSPIDRGTKDKSGYKDSSSTPTNQGKGISDDEKEKRKQEALAKAEARKKAKADNASTTDASADTNEGSSSDEGEAKILPQQIKAIENLLNLLQRKRKDDFDKESFLLEQVSMYGAEKLEQITAEQAKELISTINKEMRAK